MAYQLWTSQKFNSPFADFEQFKKVLKKGAMLSLVFTKLP